LGRHPDLREPAAASVDTTDYYFRHPELSSTSDSNVDLTDYYFRHIHNQSLPEPIATQNRSPPEWGVSLHRVKPGAGFIVFFKLTVVSASCQLPLLLLASFYI